MLPADFKKALLTDASVSSAWNSLTPLARNEWICWVVSVKLDDTRAQHIVRAVRELKEGKRRPCCWMGCIHRTDKPMSTSQKFVVGRTSSVAK